MDAKERSYVLDAYAIYKSIGYRGLNFKFSQRLYLQEAPYDRDGRDYALMYERWAKKWMTGKVQHGILSSQIGRFVAEEIASRLAYHLEEKVEIKDEDWDLIGTYSLKLARLLYDPSPVNVKAYLNVIESRLHEAMGLGLKPEEIKAGVDLMLNEEIAKQVHY